MNRLAEQGFARAAEDYARARPSYPPAAIDWLREQAQLTSESAVLDLGAGTGKLTALLTGLGRVIAVEPVAEMRAELAKLPFVEAREGKAEAIPLAEGQVDAVTIGQAFHWFATKPVLTELHRVLRPRGQLALLWNRWDRSVGWADALKTLTAPYDQLRPQYESGTWKAAFEGQQLFGPLRSATFANPHPLSPEDVIARMASTSTIAVLPPPEREALFRKLREVLATHPDTVGRGQLPVPYLTEVWVSQRQE